MNGRGAGNDGQLDEVLERIRGEAESGEARHDDAQRRAVRIGTSQTCQGCFQHLRGSFTTVKEHQLRNT